MMPDFVNVRAVIFANDGFCHTGTHEHRNTVTEIIVNEFIVEITVQGAHHNGLDAERYP